MFRIIDFKLLLRYIAIFTTAVSIVFYSLAQHFMASEIPIIRMLSVAPWAVLFVTLIITINRTSRFIWNILRKVNPSLYPDLNGTWEGEIITENDNKIEAKALIKQNLIYVQIDMHTETSKSLTLEATPVIDSGQFKLYYMYRSIPKKPSWPTYTGSTIFDIRTVKANNKSLLEISGYYFTDRKTIGRVRLSQINSNLNSDPSYY